MMQLISAVGATGWTAYVIASMCVFILRAAGQDIPPLARAVRAELKPFALPLILAATVPDALAYPDPVSVGVVAMCVVGWWLSRHDKDDDDRWKRRRQRLAAKVAAVAGRLAVVPAESPA